MQVVSGISHCDALLIIETPLSGPLYIVTHEPGLETGPLPTWADRGDGAVQFDAVPAPVERVEIEGVPGAFQLRKVLSPGECRQFVALAENCGFHDDSPVSLPHSVRHNANLNWVVSESIDGEIWTRCAPHVRDRVGGMTARGLNARFRFYRYRAGDFFKPHTDGAWPGSRVIDGNLVTDAYGITSWYTFLLFLSGGYQGGRTQFHVEGDTGLPVSWGHPAKVVSVETAMGDALCFPHGSHPMHCVHSGEVVASGTKYIIRSDILFD